MDGMLNDRTVVGEQRKKPSQSLSLVLAHGISLDGPQGQLCQALHKLINQNKEPLRTTSFLTIHKVVRNICKNPFEEQLRRIKASGEKVQARLLGAEGAREALAAVGFAPRAPGRGSLGRSPALVLPEQLATDARHMRACLAVIEKMKVLLDETKQQPRQATVQARPRIATEDEEAEWRDLAALTIQAAWRRYLWWLEFKGYLRWRPKGPPALSAPIERRQASRPPSGKGTTFLTLGEGLEEEEEEEGTEKGPHPLRPRSDRSGSRGHPHRRRRRPGLLGEEAEAAGAAEGAAPAAAAVPPPPRRPLRGRGGGGSRGRLKTLDSPIQSLQSERNYSLPSLNATGSKPRLSPRPVSPVPPPCNDQKDRGRARPLQPSAAAAGPPPGGGGGNGGGGGGGGGGRAGAAAAARRSRSWAPLQAPPPAEDTDEVFVLPSLLGVFQDKQKESQQKSSNDCFSINKTCSDQDTVAEKEEEQVSFRFEVVGDRNSRQMSLQHPIHSRRFVRSRPNPVQSSSFNKPGDRSRSVKHKDAQQGKEDKPCTASKGIKVGPKVVATKAERKQQKLASKNVENMERSRSAAAGVEKATAAPAAAPHPANMDPEAALPSRRSGGLRLAQAHIRLSQPEEVLQPLLAQQELEWQKIIGVVKGGGGGDSM